MPYEASELTMQTKPFPYAVLALVASGVLLLTGCSAGPPTTPTGGGTPGANRQGGRNPGFGGVSGLIVAVTGKTLQVRTTSGQSSVTYTGKTAISESRR